MIIKNINKIIEFSGTKFVAVDFGTKRFGIAASDGTNTIATPVLNYERKDIKSDVAKIKEMLDEYGTKTLVFGLPKDDSGYLADTVQKIKSFVNIVNQELKEINIFFFDERYSSKAAERISSFKEFRKESDDKIAASIFLQTLLDFIKNKT
jgi:putative Holliday junction resolvase